MLGCLISPLSISGFLWVSGRRTLGLVYAFIKTRHIIAFYYILVPSFLENVGRPRFRFLLPKSHLAFNCIVQVIIIIASFYSF